MRKLTISSLMVATLMLSGCRDSTGNGSSCCLAVSLDENTTVDVAVDENTTVDVAVDENTTVDVAVDENQTAYDRPAITSVGYVEIEALNTYTGEIQDAGYIRIETLIDGNTTKTNTEWVYNYEINNFIASDYRFGVVGRNSFYNTIEELMKTLI